METSEDSLKTITKLETIMLRLSRYSRVTLVALVSQLEIGLNLPPNTHTPGR